MEIYKETKYQKGINGKKIIKNDIEKGSNKSIEENNFEFNSEKIMNKKPVRNNRKRSKWTNKERAFKMVKILGQGAFANVYLVETKETG